MVADEPTRLSPNTARRLAELGIGEHLTAPAPIQLSEVDLLRASRSIALRKDEHWGMVRRAHPEWVDRIEYWDVRDIDEIGPDDALPAIEQQVERLIRTYA